MNLGGLRVKLTIKSGINTFLTLLFKQRAFIDTTQSCNRQSLNIKKINQGNDKNGADASLKISI